MYGGEAAGWLLGGVGRDWSGDMLPPLLRVLFGI